ncbi:unnamed protein product [Parnassius mnemosyne]|uniref:Odorant receptor n=1 Tax=Parnassius mnemosyne TaxID=213953 RepID=A0AAV1L5U0_9NEOP
MASETRFFDKSLKRLKFIFLCTGLNLERNKSDKWHTIKKRSVYIFNFIWLNSDIIGAVFWITDKVKNGKDMTEITYLAPCATLSLVATLKSLYLIIYEDYVGQLIKQLRELDENASDMDTVIKIKTEKEERRFLNLVINLLNILNIGMVVNFTFSPLILIAIKYIRTRELELMLPFLDVYPFDPLDIRYWPLIYMKQIWSECIVLLEICGADYLYYICCTYIRIQFRLLRHELVQLIADRQPNQNVYLRNGLIKLIKWHQSLIKAVNTLEIIYSRSTLFNFVLSSVIICLTGFNVTAINNVAFAVTFLTFLSMSLLQIFFLCLFGDMIMSSSQEVSDAVYNSLWYAADWRVGKDLLLVQIRAQKPCKLTAFGFADVNLRAFTRIISTAWSYFALLKTMYNTNQD